MTSSPVKHQEKNYGIPTTSTPNHTTQRIGDTSVIFLTSKILPPVGKEYMCFHIDGKST